MTGEAGALGRFHETTERGIAMRDLGVHDPAMSEYDLPTWIDRQKRFGIQVQHKILVVPTDEVGDFVRLDEWKAGTV